MEDPRINVQSILSRHFLIATLFGEKFQELGLQELRFAGAMNWLATLSLVRTGASFSQHGFAVQALHIGSYLRWRIGCNETHNPNAYPSSRSGAEFIDSLLFGARGEKGRLSWRRRWPTGLWRCQSINLEGISKTVPRCYDAPVVAHRDKLTVSVNHSI